MTCKVATLGNCEGVSTLIHDDGAGNVRKAFPDTQNSELPLWDSVANEPTRLSGTTFRLYAVRRAMHRHPLYGEPTHGGHDWEFHGPWEMLGALEFDQGNEIDTEASSEGIQKIASAILWIPRKEIERVGSPRPKVGDVINVWDKPPFKSQFEYWDVTKANPDGNIWTSEAFVQFRCELRHRSKFEPGRKVEGTKV